MNRRRITALAILLLLGGGVAFFVFIRQAAAPGGPVPGGLPVIGGRARLGGAEGTGQTEPPAAGPGQEKVTLVEIVTTDVLAPTLSADGKSLYYIDRASGHILTSDLDGNNEKTITNLTLLEAYAAVWSPQKTYVTIFYHESGITKKFVSSLATATPSRFLPQDVTSFAWSPDGRELAYLVTQGGETRLVIADAALRQTRTAYTTPVPDFTLAWANRTTLLLVSRPSGLAPSLVLAVNPESRRAEPIIAGRPGVVAVAAPDGSGIIYSKSSSTGAADALAFRRLSDGTEVPLGIHTIAEKCAFARGAARAFCGVPSGAIPPPSPDVWYQGAVSFTDAIVEVNIESGATETRMAGEANLDVTWPFVSTDNRYLFFQDKNTGTLWRFTLSDQE